MMPGMNPRQMQQMMQRMGMQQVEVPAERVIVRLKDRDLVFDEPQLVKVTVMGQQTYQLTGTPREEKRSMTYVPASEDVATVAEQAGVTIDRAREALIKTNGDIAEAILALQ
jgi:nascent polypeptide-associated complex subunit alpha